MAKDTQTKKQTTDKKEMDGEKLWRKPIMLDSFDDEDPLASLYQGREVSEKKETTKTPSKPQKVNRSETTNKKPESPQKTTTSEKSKSANVRKTTKRSKPVSKSKTNKKSKVAASTKLTEEELKNLLKIKSESFEFTDIREILRGKSLDIYAYLRHLAGDAGVCKIKHNDLMSVLNISRPTLFKQGDWLVQLNLIEKHSVPGDHMGTSYTVRRLEDALPLSETLVEQIESFIEDAGWN